MSLEPPDEASPPIPPAPTAQSALQDWLNTYVRNTLLAQNTDRYNQIFNHVRQIDALIQDA